MGEDLLIVLAHRILERIDVGWSFLLLLTRYSALLVLLPGIGGGVMGLPLRYPAILALSLVSLNIDNPTPVPHDMALMAMQFASEAILGGVTGMIPLLIVSGAATAGQIASGTMGLNGAQLFDPTTSTSQPDLSRIYSDLSVILFLLIGGHYVAVAALTGMDDFIAPGSFVLSGTGVETLVTQSGRIFQTGCMIAAPVIVALLLTNFIMGLISKAVPTINLFILSFPLTIGIGLLLSMLALPEVIHLLNREFLELERLTGLVTH